MATETGLFNEESVITSTIKSTFSLKRKAPGDAETTNPPTTVDNGFSSSPRAKLTPLTLIDGNIIPLVNKKLKAGPFVEDYEDEEKGSLLPKSPIKTFDEPGHTRAPEDPFETSVFNEPILQSAPRHKAHTLCTASGRRLVIRTRNPPITSLSTETGTTLLERTTGKAVKSFFGVNIHQLLEEQSKEDSQKVSRTDIPEPAVAITPPSKQNSKQRTLLWTEKYRAKRFTDLVGDERTHRSVLKWIKGWDPIVFPHQARSATKSKKLEKGDEEKVHRKVLLITGPPGLGKTTLAHVAARQAGYDCIEINASDERTKDVVHGKIRDCVGTETIRSITDARLKTQTNSKARPVCVIVDEVDGVVGSSGGDNGFVKALIDLIQLDKKNSDKTGQSSTNLKKRKDDNFRLLRPLVLVCNDVYHPSLKPLRLSGLAEIVHIRKPPLALVVARMKHIFEAEGFKFEGDGVRRLCEAAWGITNKKQSISKTASPGEGDLRGVMVVAEWTAAKLRSISGPEPPFLTRQWVEQNIVGDLTNGGSASRAVRSGVKDVMDRVFVEGAGFGEEGLKGTKTTTGKNFDVAEIKKQRTMKLLREMVDAAGDHDRIIGGKSHIIDRPPSD
jgi:chromosome transmission fidelity protein 18